MIKNANDKVFRVQQTIGQTINVAEEAKYTWRLLLQSTTSLSTVTNVIETKNGCNKLKVFQYK